MGLFRKLRIWWHDLDLSYGWYRYCCEMETEYDGKDSKDSKWGYTKHVVFEVADPFIHLFKRAICKVRGHDWADEGWAGPESGCIDMVCQRCGRSNRTWLY